MKKFLMTLTNGRARAAFAAVLCCAMTTTVHAQDKVE